jgi:hypothetical protein
MTCVLVNRRTQRFVSAQPRIHERSQTRPSNLTRLRVTTTVDIQAF